jgi:steroid 5-alpha reductase family enzyme
LTIFSPLIMTFLLVRVSGVAMLEKSLKDKKPEYVDYIKRTSAFIPRPPQK